MVNGPVVLPIGQKIARMSVCVSDQYVQRDQPAQPKPLCKLAHQRTKFHMVRIFWVHAELLHQIRAVHVNTGE